MVSYKTLNTDIERELQYYQSHFDNKVVYCNCDNPLTSNFFKYFFFNFKKLGLKKLIAACYKEQVIDLFRTESNTTNGFFYEYTGDDEEKPDLSNVVYFRGDGDFRSQESINLLKQSDIVVTNPLSLYSENMWHN